VIVSSVRDVLVRGRGDQQAHDEVAAALANAYLDAVLVHGDPRLARFEETFRPRVPLRVPVHYTGYVVRGGGGVAAAPRGPHVLVSAGGGRVGGPLLRAALEAQRLLGVPMRVVAGPFLPEREWEELREAVRELVAQSHKVRSAARVQLVRTVPDLGAELRSAAASVSQCGYNTALEVLRAGLPAVVVPFADGGEDEQLRRARRLADLGAVRLLEPDALDGATLAAELDALQTFRPRPLALDLDGARASARSLAELARPRLAEAALA
jgi:predicted glycosyltransferase